ncbi:MAG TPA: DUF4142 domain-containing protein [Gemmatimonadales bacterium]|nr:DUF4142 domain-containing protein [Gemmatimonadales bacterium]
MVLLSLMQAALAHAAQTSATVVLLSTAAAPPPIVTPLHPTALDDATIVAIFDAANTLDIKASDLALNKSHNKDVRSLAKTFRHDHTAVRQKGRDLAKKLGVTPTPPASFALADQHAQAMKDLKSKSGAEFDRAYAAEEVKYHQDVIDALNTTLLPAIQNAELKSFVQSVVPAFQGHLAAAKALQQKLGESS